VNNNARCSLTQRRLLKAVERDIDCRRASGDACR
jgi:hypothetical protein